MNEALEGKYNQTLTALNELFEMVELKDLTKVSEVYSRVNSLKAEVEKSFKLDQHPAVKSLLERELDGHILAFAEKNNSLNSVTVQVDRNQDIEAWNRNLTWAVKLLDLVTLFKPEGDFDCQMTGQRLSLRFERLGEFDVEMVRPRSYFLTRELLDNKGMLTFNVEENSIEFNLSWEDHQNYLWVFQDQETGMHFALPQIIANYEIDSENLAKKGKHLTYTFDRNFSLRETENLEFSEQKEAETILHFSFLFRPVSFIIPYEGQILPAMRIQGKPGWQPLWSGQDVGQISIQYVDWFKLIQS